MKRRRRALCVCAGVLLLSASGACNAVVGNEDIRYRTDRHDGGDGPEGARDASGDAVPAPPPLPPDGREPDAMPGGGGGGVPPDGSFPGDAS